MNKQYNHPSVSLRFKRWSRKNYAAFISIQRAVTIGQLSANVSERFETKNGSVHTSALSADRAAGCESDEEDPIFQNETLQTTAAFWLSVASLSIQITIRPAAAQSAYTLINRISERAEGFSDILNAFRSFRLYKYKTI